MTNRHTMRYVCNLLLFINIKMNENEDRELAILINKFFTKLMYRYNKIENENKILKQQLEQLKLENNN